MDELTDRDMAIEGYGQDYKGVLPDGTVTGVMSYDGRVFKHYVETGMWESRHPKWEQDYDETPLRTAFECLATNGSIPKMFTDEVSYNGTFYEREPMESCGMSGWKYDYHDKQRFRRKVLSGEIKLPAPAVFSRYGNVYIEEGYAQEVRDLFWKWARKNSNQSAVRTKGY